MKKQSIGKSILQLTLALGLSIVSFPSQSQSLQEIMGGKNQDIPLSLSLQDINSNWKKISVSGQYEMADLMKFWSNFIGIKVYDNTYYTQGKTINMSGQTYLIAYRLFPSGQNINLQTLMSEGFEGFCTDSFLPQVLTPETSLSLALLNTNTIGSLNDITAVDITDEISRSITANETAKQACEKQKLDAINSEARSYVGSMNRGQQAYFMEYTKLTNSLEDLALGIPTSTENYQYFITASGNQSFHYAQAKQDSYTSYVGGVFVVKYGEDSSTVSILCAAEKPGTTKPAPPLLQGQNPICGTGTVEVSEY